MFEYNTVVSYSKTDRNKQVPAYEILNYMQDCTTFHSETLGVGLQYMESIGKAWLLLAYHIEKNKPLVMGQKITVGTTPVDFQKVFGERQFYIKDENGDYLVKANSIWILMDMSDRKPIRIREEDTKMYPLARAFDDVSVSRRMTLSEEKERKPELKVLKTYIDNNGHVNNADYLRAAAEMLPSDYEWSDLQIIYQKEAREGDVIIPYIHNEKEGIGITFENNEGDIFTKIKIQ